MILRIAQLGQPVLRRVTEPLSEAAVTSPELQKLIDDMFETLRSVRGAGLAAPQVFESVRLFIAAVGPRPEGEELPPWEVFINPRLSELSEETESAWEGCLSFPELMVAIPRHVSLRVDYFDRQGKAQTKQLEGFAARVTQHEFDHLEGTLTIDRAQSTRDIIKASEIDAVLGNQNLED